MVVQKVLCKSSFTTNKNTIKIILGLDYDINIFNFVIKKLKNLKQYGLNKVKIGVLLRMPDPIHPMTPTLYFFQPTNRFDELVQKIGNFNDYFDSDNLVSSLASDVTKVGCFSSSTKASYALLQNFDWNTNLRYFIDCVYSTDAIHHCYGHNNKIITPQKSYLSNYLTTVFCDNNINYALIFAPYKYYDTGFVKRKIINDEIALKYYVYQYFKAELVATVRTLFKTNFYSVKDVKHMVHMIQFLINCSLIKSRSKSQESLAEARLKACESKQVLRLKSKKFAKEI